MINGSWRTMLRVAIALLALQCGASFAFVPGFVPAGRAAMALRASPRCRRMRPVVITAALSDGKDIKPSDAQAFASPQAQQELDAQIMEGVTEEGRQELRALADLTKQEQDVLRKKLEDVRSAARAKKHLFFCPCFPNLVSTGLDILH